MKEHHLKIMPEYFQAVVDGKKPFEVRYNDRDFKRRDSVILKEYSGRKEYESCPDIDTCRQLLETYDMNRRFLECPLNRKSCRAYSEDMYTGRSCLIRIKDVFKLDNADEDLIGYVAFTFEILKINQGKAKGEERK